MTEWIIDADAHLTEPPDVWTARVPARHLDHVPHVVRSNGRDTWVLEGEPFYDIGATATAGWPDPFPAWPPTYDDMHPAAHDADARLAHMDANHIWAQVLYPNVAGFGSQRFLRLGGCGDEQTGRGQYAYEAAHGKRAKVPGEARAGARG